MIPTGWYFWGSVLGAISIVYAVRTLGKYVTKAMMKNVAMSLVLLVLLVVAWHAWVSVGVSILTFPPME
jgi:hypothetical protein